MVTFSTDREIEIPPRRLPGLLAVPQGAKGIVVFAHGSGSSRLSPRNTSVSRALNRAGLATLLFDLLSPEEADDRKNVFDIPLLASRVEELSGLDPCRRSGCTLRCWPIRGKHRRSRCLDGGGASTRRSFGRGFPRRAAGSRSRHSRPRKGTYAFDRRRAR